MRVLFLLFIVIPVIEMYTLIRVGAWIGAWPTIGLVLLTAFIGAALLRQQGLSTLLRANQRMASGEVPAQEMAEGLVLAVGGALLLTPGFFTDAFGFFCLLPFTRKYMIKHVLLRIFSRMEQDVQVQVYRAGPGPGWVSRDDRGSIIDGEFERREP